MILSLKHVKGATMKKESELRANVSTSPRYIRTLTPITHPELQVRMVAYLWTFALLSCVLAMYVMSAVVHVIQQVVRVGWQTIKKLWIPSPS